MIQQIPVTSHIIRFVSYKSFKYRRYRQITVWCRPHPLHSE